jgi:hypothetical protein
MGPHASRLRGTSASTTEAFHQGPRLTSGALLLVGILGGALVIVGDLSGSLAVGTAGLAVVAVCLVAAGLLAWRDARRRGRSVAKALWDSVREVLRWFSFLW